MSSFDKRYEGGEPLPSSNTQYHEDATTPSLTCPSKLSWGHRISRYLIIVFCLIFFSTRFHIFTDNIGVDLFRDSGRVNWALCGDGFEGYECAKITLPLDYHNESDPRTVTISVNRYLATNVTHRKGAVFINPGGPGASGTSMAFKMGIQFSTILKAPNFPRTGQYDIIGFDPRGVNQTLPNLSCFESQFDSDVFTSLINDFSLNLPVNITSNVLLDLQIQINRMAAQTAALAAKCFQRGGDSMAYFGTEAVVRDIDAMSKLIEGEQARINYWGLSYGTIIGQYMIKILSPERIGRVLIDGVVDPDLWSDYPTRVFEEGLDNVDDVLASFASSCSSAGDACALSSFKPTEILAKIDATVSSLYYTPVPITDLHVPAIATAANLRSLLFLSMYNIKLWPQLAENLANAFRGNMTGIVDATMPNIDASEAPKQDFSPFVTLPIFCADSKPYNDFERPPSNGELASYLVAAMHKNSYRMGDRWFALSLCHLWEGVYPLRSRYEGTFELEDGTLDTPILVLSNTYDPATPLVGAIHANERLGDNARLVQQVDGWGHSTVNQKSFCTAEIVSAYMVDGKVPELKHTLCEVDQKPFKPFDASLVIEEPGVDMELRKAWLELSLA